MFSIKNLQLILLFVAALTNLATYSFATDLAFPTNTVVKRTTFSGLTETIAQTGVGEKFITDLSGVELFHWQSEKYLVLASDEGCSLLVVPTSGNKLVVDKARSYHLLELFFSSNVYSEVARVKELDLEALAISGEYLFATASASTKRKKPKGKSVSKDHKRLTTLSRACKKPIILTLNGTDKEIYPSDLLYVLKIVQDRRGNPLLKSHSVFNLRASLQRAKAYIATSDKPSKDNGLDVEGITVANHELLLGLRGPVLRGHALVASYPLETILRKSASVKTIRRAPTMYFLYLGGLGIRALETVRDSVYIIAGMTMDIAKADFSLYKWNGKTDTFKQKKVKYSKDEFCHLIDISPKNLDLKPESLTFDEKSEQLFIHCDGEEELKAYELIIK